MDKTNKTDPTIIIIFGATGDLTSRKLIPAIYNLYLDQMMPDNFSVLGVGRQSLSKEQFHHHLLEGVNKNSRRGEADKKVWGAFAKNVSYFRGGFTDAETFTFIEKQINLLKSKWKTHVNRIFYMAVPPMFFEDIVTKLSEAGIANDEKLSRIVVEKPFGHDLESAKHLNNLLHHLFDECQIYRIDHYLGKETVQNIMAFRFANAMFEPIWNRNYIEQIQITVSEQLGVETRGNYYETAGALRDMIQNHLLQLLCLIAMEPPVSFIADEVRNRKVDVLNALRKFKPEEIHLNSVRGQYGEGWIQGKKAPGYRQEADVKKNSNKETFAAVKFLIDNWRWQGVPFYLRTGKRMNDTISVITIQFKPVPHQPFPVETSSNWQSNRLVISIQPYMGIRLRFQAKQPGLEMLLYPVDMEFNYNESYTSGTPEAYETLLLDIMKGDSTLFMRSDQVEAAWEILMPIIKAWEANPSVHFPNYAAGSDGPDDAYALIARDGHNWIINPIDKNEIQPKG